MKKDIPQLKVEDIAIAIVPRTDQEDAKDEELWDTYLINLKEAPIKSVLINTRGYGELNGSETKTSSLRYFFDEIGPLEYVKIEAILVKVFELTNEYWVSFQYDNYLYDKKYVFVKGSINEINFTTIPFIGRKGVMIR